MLSYFKKIALTKDAKYWHKLWSSWLYVALMVVTALEGLSQFAAAIIPAWQGVLSPEQYILFVAVISTIQQVSRFIKQHKLTEGESNGS